MIDAPLREYVVAIEQMKAEGGTLNDICDCSVMLVCSMMTNLATIIKMGDPDKPAEAFVRFCNMFQHELALTITNVVNQAVGKLAFEADQLDPNRTEH
jgi:hypothetical protein